MKKKFSYFLAALGSLLFSAFITISVSGFAAEKSDPLLVSLKNLTNLIKQERTLPGHTSYVRGLSFSPDGRILASASDLNGKIISGILLICGNFIWIK